jgi:outer membrane immunogenic protein
MKKTFLLSAACVALSAGSVCAADLPARKAPLPPPPPAPIWSGFYAGLNAGYNFGANADPWINQYYAVANPAAINEGYHGGGLSLMTAQNSQSGFAGGLQLGYIYQSGSYIFGLETDIQGAGIRGSSFSSGVNAFSQGSALGTMRLDNGVDFLGTVRARVGYAVTPTFIVYGTGGFTYGGVYSHANAATFINGPLGGHFGNAGSFNQTLYGTGGRSQILAGWNAGGGAEWMFAPNWSMKVEGLYWSLGSINNTVLQTGPSPISGGPAGIGWSNARVNYQGVLARFGLNYHFSTGF